jgi:hypothetical protein
MAVPSVIGRRAPGVSRIGSDRVNRPANRRSLEPCSPMAPQVRRPRTSASQVGVRCTSAVRDDDPCAAMLLDERVQSAGAPGAEADTAMAGRTAKATDGVRAVDRVPAAEEQRVRHGRHVVLARVPHARHPLHAIASGWGPVALARGGHRPRVSRRAVDADSHALGGVVNVGNHPRRCRSRKEAENQSTDSKAHGTTSQAMPHLKSNALHTA